MNELNTTVTEATAMKKVRRKFVKLQRQIRKAKRDMKANKVELSGRVSKAKTEELENDNLVLKARIKMWNEVLDYVRDVYTNKLKAEIVAIAA